MRTRQFRPDVDVAEWTGGHHPYDIIKEGLIGFMAILILVVGLSAALGSPDEHQITIRNWSQADPVDFAATALSELDGSSGTASYGAPYNNNGTTAGRLGPLHLAQWAGVRVPVNAIRDFVIAPLTALPSDPALSSALAQWKSASPSVQTSWVKNYGSITGFHSELITYSGSNAGPVPLLLQSLITMARTGALDQALVSGRNFFQLDYTKPLLFLADGGYFANLAGAQHLHGDQWGMMNETGSYPGQAWLWLYTFWYQVPPYKTSSFADIEVFATMILLTGALIFLPYIPGLRSIPRWSRVYKLIWREHYKNLRP
jgi:hypothetical protein